MSFENAAQSPGMTFRNAPFTSAGSAATLGGGKASSKSPLYSGKIRGSLTPPGKFRGRSPDKASFAPSNSNNGGRGGGGENNTSEGDRRSVNFSGQDHIHHLSDKYASSPTSTPGGGSATNSRGDGSVGNSTGGSAANNMRVPESPPPPPRQNLANVLNWGALHESLTRQVWCTNRLVLFFGS